MKSSPLLPDNSEDLSKPQTVNAGRAELSLLLHLAEAEVTPISWCKLYNSPSKERIERKTAHVPREREECARTWLRRAGTWQG